MSISPKGTFSTATEKQLKNYTFPRPWDGTMRPKSWNPLKAHLGPSTKSTYQISTIIFQGQKREILTSLLPPNRPRKLIFGSVVQLLILYRLVWNGTIFTILAPQYPLSWIWNQLNFDPSSSRNLIDFGPYQAE